jgi:hypothetical protein
VHRNVIEMMAMKVVHFAAAVGVSLGPSGTVLNRYKTGVADDRSLTPVLHDVCTVEFRFCPY